MALPKICSLFLTFNCVALAVLQPPSFSSDKEALTFFGRRFIMMPIAPPQPQTEQPHRFSDYYDEISQQDSQARRPGIVDGQTFSERSVVSEPDYDAMPVLKVSQKHLETKKLLNANPFSVQTPEEPLAVEPASDLVVDDETSSGQEPTIHLVDGETGPPSIEPPVARRFIHSN